MFRCLPILVFVATCGAIGCFAQSDDPQPKKQKDWGPVKKLYFVFADKAIIHVDGSERRVVDEKQVESILRETAKDWVVHPHFKMTQSGINHFDGFRKNMWEIYRDLYDAKKIRGMTQGALSPRSYHYWDRIATNEDFWVDAETLRLGRVVDAEGKPVKGAEAMLLPEKHINGVYLRDGFNRDPLAEHLAYTDVLGKFRLDVWEDDAWVVVVCPQGFVAARLDDFEGTINLTLKPWAQVKGKLVMQLRDGQAMPALSEYPVLIRSLPIPGISFNLYETEAADDGSFRQRYVPPGNVTVSRSFALKKGGSMSFGEKTFELSPGEVREVEFGPITDKMRTTLNRE